MKPQLHRHKQDPLFDHARVSVVRVYGALAVIAELLRQDDRPDLAAGLRHTLEQFPSIRTLSSDMTTPKNCRELQLWCAAEFD